MSDYPHVPAAFINAIAEEGTKTEAIEWLQKQWNECASLRNLIEHLREEKAAWMHETDLAKNVIDWLRAENADLRRWKAMDKPLTAAMAVVNSDVQELRAENERLRAENERLKNELSEAPFIRTR